nr:glycoside hydrolase family 5 subfamily 2 [Spondylis buprestoides]
MRSTLPLICLIVLSCTVYVAFSKDAALETVSKHGKLSVSGNDLVDASGEKVQLKGMALYWSIWKPQYWNQATIDGIHSRCHSNVVRASMAVDTQSGGYLTDPEGQLALVETIIEAAIKDDIYVIVDWHEEHAYNNLEKSQGFFDTISKKYGSYPNIMYETFNEPTDADWATVIKPYHEAVIQTIRANDPDNIIIVGTPWYSQRLDLAVADPITTSTNIMYTLHFYAGTHKQWLRDLAQTARDDGLPIFITEYGTDNIDEVNAVDEDESKLWWTWLDENNLSYTNWAICDVDEASAALVADTTPAEVCEDDYLTLSGKLVVAQNKA